MSSEPQTDPVFEPLGPAPDDAEGFDAWARRGHDGWQRTVVLDEARRRWADETRPVADRLLAGVWGSPVGAPPASELRSLLDDPGVDAVLRARAEAAIALERATPRSEEAVALIRQAVGALGDDVPIRTRLSVWLTAAQVYARVGNVPEALQLLATAGELVRADDTAPAWALVAIDAERLNLMAPRVPDRQQFAASVDQVAAAASALPPTPIAVDVVVKMSALLCALGAARRAERYAERVVALTGRVPEAVGARFQAQMVLADALLAAEGPESALVAQQAAIDTMAPLGPSPMLGWAHRGLAVHLRTLDRHAEAADAFGRASDTYREAGILADAAALRLEQAEALLHADRAEEATALAQGVLDGLDDVPEANRAVVALQANRVQALLAAAEGDLDGAAEHWLEVAELAPTVGRSDLEARLTAAQLYAADGDDAEADAQFLRAELSAAEEPDPARATATVMRVRAEVLRDAGRPEEAAEVARLAANHARTGGDEAQAVYLSVIAADSLHAAGESGAAVQLYEETIAAAAAAELRELQGAVHAGLAVVLRDLGRTGEAAIHEAEAQTRNPGAPPRR